MDGEKERFNEMEQYRYEERENDARRNKSRVRRRKRALRRRKRATPKKNVSLKGRITLTFPKTNTQILKLDSLLAK